jgi:general secretion pathway protein J
MSSRGARGFTLLELVLALAIVGALLVIMFGGLRVALAAWTVGERRTDVLEHERGLVQLLSRSVSATYPYQAEDAGADQGRILFHGEPTQLSFVTLEPPMPSPAPIAFTAVTITQDAVAGLVIRQQVLPNRAAFELAQPVDPGSGEWRERWDADSDEDLPRALEIRLATAIQGRLVEEPVLIVPIRAVRP